MSTLSARLPAVPSKPTKTLVSVATVLVRGLVELQRRYDLHRSRRQLALLDDRMLRDIGIDRATAKNEALKSFWG